ncbi:7415_t:CDS:2, partial [Acaulospora morrowiae]
MNVHPERTLSSTSPTNFTSALSSGGGVTSKTKTLSISLDKTKQKSLKVAKNKTPPTSPKTKFTKSKFFLSKRPKLDTSTAKVSSSTSPTVQKKSRPISPVTSKPTDTPEKKSSVKRSVSVSTSREDSNSSFINSPTSILKKKKLPVVVEPNPENSSSSTSSLTITTDISSNPSSCESSPHTPTSSQATTLTMQSPSTPSLTSDQTIDDEDHLDITMFLAAPRLTQRVRLNSGRVISFSEVGDRNGFPVFVFLGMGCVRYFIAFFDELALSYGLRLICPDRPGIGLSDDVKSDEQEVLKWPGVIDELCNILDIPQFFLMAHSAGSPYALACAIKIPQRIKGTIYLVCPWVSTTVANNFKWLRFVPTPIMKFTNSAGISIQQMIHGRQPYSTKPASQRTSGALAAPISGVEKKQQLGLAILKASFAENLAGANNDLMMCFERHRPFGFSYTDVDLPVHVFHGTKDERVPVSAVQWMEENMPDCRLTLIEGGRHSLFLRAEVVDTIFKSIAVQFHVRGSCRMCKVSTKCWLQEEAERLKKERELQIQKKVESSFAKLTRKASDIDMRAGNQKFVMDRSSADQIPQAGEKLLS